MADHDPTDFEIRVVEVLQETPIDRTIRFEVTDDERAPFAFEPGQHVCIWDPDDAETKRYFSISGGDAAARTFQVTIRRSKEAEPPFYALPVHQALRMAKPAGSFVLAYAPGDRLLLVGGGSGITPFRAYVEALARVNDAPPTTVVQSVREAGELLFRAEFEAWAAKAPWFTYAPIVTGSDEDWAGRKGRLDKHVLEGLIDDPEHTIVCACGPGGFVDTVLESARALGVPEGRCRREGW